ncbi:DNA (cytosine-5-)-methyltransferase [Crocosphaera sp. XPORK-15E]|uniref:DNA cytosine methyltransferase n=1 Tax=Crocosphaera sp. XPORK-15E TaxID=3110247 RepID=UPI002B1EB240|nr:DNA (cytosine-5-)-methyltransferase [Crocosphaera sp. XPORK-15E]MEA5533430.1 DNA (cytosine-5-)-methyltransferase [Crocosphaera sp. XPORK-15E]
MKEIEQRKTNKHIGHYFEGTDANWYIGRNLTDEEREVFRQRSIASHQAKIKALNGDGPPPIHKINVPKLNPEDLMPKLKQNHLKVLSLFSGGGGLDLGFDHAGFQHYESYEIMRDAAVTIVQNRPKWNVFYGEDGNVRNKNWKLLKDKIDVIHGGPPCQPFSLAGYQRGSEDDRDLFPEFIRAILEIKPKAFVAENVKALTNKKFETYLNQRIISPLSQDYKIFMFELSAASFGVPQKRDRVFLVGLRKDKISKKFVIPKSTHDFSHLLSNKNHQNPQQLSLFDELISDDSLLKCMGVREALGLPNIGYDALSPTIRSGLTGPRHTTSILSSVSAQKQWEKLEIWPNGVAKDRLSANQFVTKNGHFRLSVQDCGIMQGFPKSWVFNGAVYMILGQIGNSVAPPMAYHVAKELLNALI